MALTSSLSLRLAVRAVSRAFAGFVQVGCVMVMRQVEMSAYIRTSKYSGEKDGGWDKFIEEFVPGSFPPF